MQREDTNSEQTSTSLVKYPFAYLKFYLGKKKGGLRIYTHTHSSVKTSLKAVIFKHLFSYFLEKMSEATEAEGRG